MFLRNVSLKCFTVCQFWSGSVCFLIWPVPPTARKSRWTECLHQPPMCKLSISSRPVSETKAGEQFWETDAVLTSHEDCRRCPAPPAWGATQTSTLRAELCKHAHKSFSSAVSRPLNANSKYSQRCTARWKMVINTAEIIQN